MRARRNPPNLRRPLLALAVAATVPACMPAAGRAASSDIAATHAYVRADYALERAGVALIPLVERRARKLITALARECPKVGSGAPQDEASQPMSYEAAVALWAVEYGSAKLPIARFVRATAHLRWSSDATTTLARAYARDLTELAAIRVPSLCEDVRAWKQTGFQVIPPAALSLVRRAEAIEPEPVPPGRLVRYARGADAILLARSQRLERRLTEEEFLVGQTDWLDTLEALGINQ
jgi:hypothetical protein